jgi:hypothetical protein
MSRGPLLKSLDGVKTLRVRQTVLIYTSLATIPVISYLIIRSVHGNRKNKCGVDG